MPLARPGCSGAVGANMKDTAIRGLDEPNALPSKLLIIRKDCDGRSIIKAAGECARVLTINIEQRRAVLVAHPSREQQVQ